MLLVAVVSEKVLCQTIRSGWSSRSSSKLMAVYSYVMSKLMKASNLRNAFSMIKLMALAVNER